MPSYPGFYKIERKKVLISSDKQSSTVDQVTVQGTCTRPLLSSTVWTYSQIDQSRNWIISPNSDSQHHTRGLSFIVRL